MGGKHGGERGGDRRGEEDAAVKPEGWGKESHGRQRHEDRCLEGCDCAAGVDG